MRVAIPHSLPREEVRRRIRDRSGSLMDVVPGGIATVETAWSGEDTMDMAIKALGQNVAGKIEVEDHQLVVTFDIPAQLGFIGSMIEKQIREKGQKLLT